MEKTAEHQLCVSQDVDLVPETLLDLATATSHTPLVLRVEPWANEILMELGEDYFTVFDASEGEVPAVEWKKDSITLYGW